MATGAEAAAFLNRLKIMRSLDEVDMVIGRQRAQAFHADPIREATRMSDNEWRQVFDLILRRE